MSIQDSGGGGPVSYADHDVHHVRHKVVNRSGTGGDDITFTSSEQFEITERGLDPDELAELRAMRISIGSRVEAGADQTQRGELSFTIDAGFNTSDAEVIRRVPTDFEQFDPDGDATNEIGVSTSDTDEVGQIYTFADNLNVGYDDATNGKGAGGQNNAETEMLNMADLFGSGPYVDAADDFVSTVHVEPDNIVELAEVDVVYTLYYNVQQTEGGRSRFGR